MTRDKLIDILKYRGYSYEIVGDKIVIDDAGPILLDTLQSIPDNIDFRNNGYMSLDGIKSIPTNVTFNNRGSVHLRLFGIHSTKTWEYGIPGINSKALLNGMIKRGLFL